MAAPHLAPASRLATTPPVDAAAARWERWIPEWARRIAAPVWVTAPGPRLVYLNERAERLLATTSRAAVGQACQAIVAARTATGASFCCAECPLVAAADAGDDMAPVEVQVGGRAGRPRHWLQMTVIPVAGPDGEGHWMVHVARVADRDRRLERWVASVARRSEAIRETEAPAARRPLSARENEILDLLAQDVEPSRVAAELGLSCVTVRNHVQHVLAKLGAHSIEEAVAMRLLAAD